jgi:hypothetical protein
MRTSLRNSRVQAPLLLATLALGAAASAEEAGWILEPALTPATLAADGAALTANDTVRWPEGPSVDITYWRGGGDVVYRCATLSGAGTSSASCWRQQLVAPSADSRHIHTRQRPAPIVIGSAQSVGFAPYVWLEGGARHERVPPGPRPTPLPRP